MAASPVTDLGVELLATGKAAYAAADRTLLDGMDAAERAQLSSALLGAFVRTS